MRNEVFNRLPAELSPFFGRAEPLRSGNGNRHRSRGNLTVYHEHLVAGNQVEIAFEPTSIARFLSTTEVQVRSLVESIRRRTGREINFNPRYRWPRVGIANQADAQLVLRALRAGLFAQVVDHGPSPDA